MFYEKNPLVLAWDHDPEESSFATVLDAACERLWQKQLQYSVRRIREMDEKLVKLEKELDKFIGSRHE